MISGWWIMKVVCGLLLAGHAIAAFADLYSLHLRLLVPLPVAQAVVVLGAAITIWHFVILKTALPDISRPKTLIVDRGLFAAVRHPMYLGDLILYAGLAMLTGDPVAWILASIGAVAIVGQCRVEDRAMGERFGNEHGVWQRRTHMLVPWTL